MFASVCHEFSPECSNDKKKTMKELKDEQDILERIPILLSESSMTLILLPISYPVEGKQHTEIRPIRIGDKTEHD